MVSPTVLRVMHIITITFISGNKTLVKFFFFYLLVYQFMVNKDYYLLGHLFCFIYLVIITSITF